MLCMSTSRFVAQRVVAHLLREAEPSEPLLIALVECLVAINILIIIRANLFIIFALADKPRLRTLLEMPRPALIVLVALITPSAHQLLPLIL